MQETQEKEIQKWYYYTEKITDIYKNFNNSIEDVHIVRYDQSAKLFRQKFGRDPEYFVIAPGQIELFAGALSQQHDYKTITFNLEQDIVILYSKISTSKITLVNQQTALYPELQFDSDPSKQNFSEDNNNNELMNLFLWGYQGALQGNQCKFTGLQIMIASNLQIKCGLNSSSALVLGVSIMTLLANNLLKQTKLEDLLYKLKNVQNQSNQICKDNLKNYLRQTTDFNHCWIAKLSQQAEYFTPKKLILQGDEFALPQGYCFILANSLIQSPKFMKQGNFFQQRQAELQLAVAYLVKKLEMNYESFQSLGKLQTTLDCDIDEMINIVNEQFELQKQPISKIDLEKFMGVPLEQIISNLPNSKSMIEEVSSFSLYKRLLYILQEQKFILDATEILNKTSLPPKECAKQLGQIMNNSKKNSIENYQELTLQMKELLKLFESHNSVLGCKMVGEASNGCVLALIEIVNSRAVSNDIQDCYYSNKKNKLFLTDDLNILVVPSLAATKGICVFDPQYEIWF